eukprot:jgi/Bigna1/126301/aug1.2_g1009
MIAVASVLVAVLLFQVGGSRGIRDARRGMIQPQRTQHALRENGNSNAGRRFMRLKEYLSDLLGGAAAQGQAEKEARAVAGPKPTDQTTRWPWWFVLPIQPGEFRPTTMKEVVAGKVWVFDQLQGAINILVNVRMTILRLEKGGLLVYAPIAPTEEAIASFHPSSSSELNYNKTTDDDDGFGGDNECVSAMIRDLEQKHGNVRHIVLPTQAVEHKIFLGPFARRFPNSEVWVEQYQSLWEEEEEKEEDNDSDDDDDNDEMNDGLGRRVHTLEGQKDGEGDFPDDDDVTAITLFAETALYHHSTGSLLVTDTLVYVPQQPLEITTLDPFGSPLIFVYLLFVGLLFHARNVEGDPIVNTPAKILEGWIKTIPTPFIRQLVLRRFEADIERSKYYRGGVALILFLSHLPGYWEWVAKIGEMCPGINRVIPCHFEVAEGIDTKGRTCSWGINRSGAILFASCVFLACVATGATFAMINENGDSKKGAGEDVKKSMLEGEKDRGHGVQIERLEKSSNLKYLLYTPKAFEAENKKNEDRRWPLLVFLHGAGEMGSGTAMGLIADGATGCPQVELHYKRAIPELHENFVVASPRTDRGWGDASRIKTFTQNLIDDKGLHVDPHRVYLTGVSMGGAGVWRGATTGLFAAVAPVCAAGVPKASDIKVPVWAFHGANDQVVPVDYTDRSVAMIKKANLRLEIKYTRYNESPGPLGYPGYDGHDGPDLIKWMLLHTNEKK